MDTLEDTHGLEMLFMDNHSVEWNPSQKQIDRMTRAKVNDIALNFIDIQIGSEFGYVSSVSSRLDHSTIN